MADTTLSSIPTCILTKDGAALTPYRAISLADAAAQEPPGVYTIGRTYQRDHTLLLDDHLDRLEESARLTGIAVTLDRAALRRAIRDLIAQTDYEDSRFRITIPHGSPDALHLAIERYKPVPPEVMLGGARCITVAMQRANPAAKTTEWAHARKSTVEAFPSGVYEGILIDDHDALLEGTSSNFYAVMDGTLYTAGEGVLAGIAQRIVLSVAPDVIEVARKPIHKNDLPFLEECFISSAGRGVVPVIVIDQQVISGGMPGPITLAIRERYDDYTAARIEAL